jgi:hypothetical protein
MGLYEGIKDVARVVQQADNVDLYRQLIELSSQALEMQSEITRLSIENSELRKKQEIESHIERHKETYVTLTSDSTLYCSHCWDNERKLLQMQCHSNGKYNCIHCTNEGVYDSTLYQQYLQRNAPVFIKTNNRNRW